MENCVNMKKFILLFIILVISVFGFNKFILDTRGNNPQYVQEINQVIATQTPIIKKNIDGIEQEIKAESDPNIKQVIIEQGVNEELFKFYMELINITNKYVKINKPMPITDWHGDLQKYINPTLKKYKVDTSKIDELLKYAYEKDEYLHKIYSAMNE